MTPNPISQEIEQEFFDELAEKLEKFFEKGELCQCGKRLPCRSKALTFNAYANIYLREALTCLAERVAESMVVEEIKGEEETGNYNEGWNLLVKLDIQDCGVAEVSTKIYNQARQNQIQKAKSLGIKIKE